MTDPTDPVQTRPDLLTDPMKSWNNPDLMIDDDFRGIIEEAYPLAFPSLDWPELRQEFLAHDRLANAAKRKINSHGIKGVIGTALGTWLIALAPLFTLAPVKNALLVAGCLSVAIGTLVCLWNFFAHTAKYERLTQRIWTERLRQFHFQYIVNNFATALPAGQGGVALATYQQTRNAILAVFIHKMESEFKSTSLREIIKRSAEDVKNLNLWAEASWAQYFIAEDLVDHAASGQLFEVLLQLRIGIQVDYANQQLDPGRRNQNTRARLTRSLADACSIAFAVVLFSGGIAFITTTTNSAFWLDLAVTVSGLLAATGLACQLIARGLGLEGDVTRYRVYLPQCELCRDRFTMHEERDHKNAQFARRIDALRELERYSYEEMRGFLKLHVDARFW